MNAYVDQTLQHTTVFLRLGKAYHASIQAFEERSGISGPRWRLLFLIYHQRDVSQKDLIRQIRVDPGSITRQIKALEADGLIERRDDALDTRLTRVRLTALGKAEVKRVLRVRRTFLGQMVQDIPPRHMDLCLKVLDQICVNLGDTDLLPLPGAYPAAPAVARKRAARKPRAAN